MISKNTQRHNHLSIGHMGFMSFSIDFPPEAENLSLDLSRHYALAELASFVRRLIFLAAVRL